MVKIEMRVTQSVHKITGFEIANLRQHFSQQGIGRDIERDAEENPNRRDGEEVRAGDVSKKRVRREKRQKQRRADERDAVGARVEPRDVRRRPLSGVL